MKEFMIFQYFPGRTCSRDVMLFIENNDAACNLFGQFKVVCGGDDRLAFLPQFQNKFHQPGLAARVETRCWFVHQPNIGLQRKQ